MLYLFRFTFNQTIRGINMKSMRLNKRVQKGFTLIELMIVVAIIGILAAIALPAYQDYIARAQASEAFTLADGMKTAIAEECQSLGACTGITVNSSIGKYVSLQNNASGVITGTFAAPASTLIAGSNVTLTPTIGTGAITWVCAGSIATKYKPKACS